MFVHVRLRKWGNSLGAVIPREVVESASLKENDEVSLSLEAVKANTAREIFGTFKTKHSAQSIKNWVRKGWE